MKTLILGCLLMAALGPAQGARTFTGTITDDMCASGDHSRMRMGATDAECTIACIVAHGSRYVLYDGAEAYLLSDQETPERFAGRRVAVTGTLDSETRTVRVETIAAAE